MRRRDFLLSVPFFFLALRTGVAFANKSSTSIEAPQTVQKGSEATIRVTVTHKGNSVIHHTKSLQVIANKKEIARWNFTLEQRPEDEIFTREVKITVLEDLEVAAEAHCSVHGSAGPANVKISVMK